MSLDFLISICLGIGLAASVGFRVFLPLLFLSLAIYFDCIVINQDWAWLGSDTAILMLLVATLIESLAYFIPLFDNALDSIAVPLAAIAGTVVVVATLADIDPLMKWTLAAIAGGGTASVISASTGVTRLASTATTAGVGNVFFSFLEMLAAITMTFLALIFPIIAAIVAIFLLLGMRWMYQKFTSKKSVRKHK